MFNRLIGPLTPQALRTIKIKNILTKFLNFFIELIMINKLYDCKMITSNICRFLP